MIHKPADPVLLAHGLLQDPGAVPLVIAVAGHRDPRPEYVPLLRYNTRLQLEQLMKELPHTPLLMLNGMAAGVDTEIAEEFLAVVTAQRLRTASTKLLPSHQLVATLPKTPEVFAGDFDDDISRQRCRSLLQRADAVLHPGNCREFIIPPLPEGQTPSDTDPTPYAQQGVFVARHSYLMLAYYDGIDTNLIGGTAHVVTIQRQEIYPLFLDEAEVAASGEPAALICHATPRLKHPIPRHQPGEIRYWSLHGHQGEWRTIDPTIPESLLELPRQLEAINMKVVDPQLIPVVRQEGRYTRLCSALEHEATALKTSHIRWIRVFIALGFALVMVAELLEGKPWFGVAVLALLASLGWLPRFQQTSKKQLIENRSLIECLAVQYLWSALGVKLDAADLFQVRNHTQLRLARLMLRAVKTQLLALNGAGRRPIAEALPQARIWMEGQVQFLSNKIRVFRQYDARCYLAAWVMGGAAAAIGFAQLIPAAPAQLYLGSIALLAASASVYAYGELIGFQETANRYQRSLEHFKRCIWAFDLPNSKEINTTGTNLVDPWLRQRIVIEAIGREKINELNDWISDQIRRIYRPGG